MLWLRTQVEVAEWSGGKECQWEGGGRGFIPTGLACTARRTVRAQTLLRRDFGARFCRRQEGVGGCGIRVCEAAVGWWRRANAVKVNGNSTPRRFTREKHGPSGNTKRESTIQKAEMKVGR